MEFIKRVEKKNKMRGLSSDLLLFSNQLDEFNSTGTRKLDSFYHLLSDIYFFEVNTKYSSSSVLKTSEFS